jgi:hypothetical protein
MGGKEGRGFGENALRKTKERECAAYTPSDWSCCRISRLTSLPLALLSALPPSLPHLHKPLSHQVVG